MIAFCLIAGYVVFSVLLWAATWIVYLADCATHWAAKRTKGTTSEKTSKAYQQDGYCNEHFA